MLWKIILILFMLFISYSLGINEGEDRMMIYVIKQSNYLNELPDDKKLEILKTDWLGFND